MKPLHVSAGAARPDEWLQRFADLAWQFNCHIASMAHESWLELPGQREDVVWSAHLVQQQGVERDHDWRLADPASRFWLIDASALETMLDAIHGLTLRPLVAKAVGKARRESLRAQLSSAAWAAATDTSVPRWSVDFPLEASSMTEGRRCCAALLIGMLDPSVRAVAQRARLRLPIAWRHDQARVLPQQASDELVAWLSRQWIPQRSLEWAWLF